MTTELVENLRESDRVQVEVGKLRYGNASSRFLPISANAHEPEEHLLCGLPDWRFECREHLVRTPRQDALEATERPISTQGQIVRDPLIEHLAEGELQHWQRSRPVGNL